MVPSLISLSSQTHIPFQLFYNRCDKSELHVFGPFLFYLRVSWCVGPIRMKNIQEVDEQELCRQILSGSEFQSFIVLGKKEYL